MKWLLFTSTLFLTGADHPAEPRASPARWQQPSERTPVPQNGICPRSYETWIWDRRRAPICVRRA